MTGSDGKSQFISGYKREYYGGGLMILIGVGAIVNGIQYSVGSLTEMGPGFFPVSLGVILGFIGLLIAGTAKRTRTQTEHEGLVHETPERMDWRGWICITAGVMSFLVLGKWGGLVPATFAITFISALGDRDNTWRSALTLAAVITVVCIVIFWWALQVQFPLFTWG
ncbi:tripartite tricarboxylate transporter TctB family protein [Paraburkholderia sp.]|uniref:tripartite tricarboxylate transporter TctB family protein n=1 Tax=Paraburkholderia sp. TaxID=1926495 RepID=UPI0039E58C34